MAKFKDTIILLFCAALASSYSIQGQLELPSITPEESFGSYVELTDLDAVNNNNQDSNDYKAPLVRRAYLRDNATFKFDNLDLGSYLIEFHTLNYVLEYAGARVDISKEQTKQDDGTEREEIITLAYEYQLGHAVHDTPNAIDYPLSIGLHPKIPQKQYYELKDKGLAATGQLGAILSNPLLLGGILFVVAMMGVPYLLEKLDPEAAQQMRGIKSTGLGDNDDDDDGKKLTPGQSMFSSSSSGGGSGSGSTVPAPVQSSTGVSKGATKPSKRKR